MFDIGFSEIVVIAVVALIVLGPEKLPKTARTLGHLFGRLQRYVNEVKADISREMELDELRKLQREVETAAKEAQTSMNAAVQQVEQGLRSVESELNQTADVATESHAQEMLSPPSPATSTSEAAPVAPVPDKPADPPLPAATTP